MLRLSTFPTDVASVLLAGLSTATNATITAADSVLSGLGKLQAQITSAQAQINSGSSILASALLKTGGTMTGALTLAADPTTALQAVTKEYADAISASIPAASSTTPGMDGTAAVGTGTTWARADHVHPTDITRAPIAGTTTNDNAAAGQVGEYISATLPQTHNVALTSNTVANITSISLTPGDWDVWGTVATKSATDTTIAELAGGISSTSLTMPTAVSGGYAAMPGGVGNGPSFALPVGTTRMSLAATTTVYLVVNCIFATDILGAYGFIGARRRR